MKKTIARTLGIALMSLIVSGCAGKALAKETKTPVQAEGKTIDEWLQIIDQQMVEYEKQPKDPVLEEIQWGCLMSQLLLLEIGICGFDFQGNTNFII